MKFKLSGVGLLVLGFLFSTLVSAQNTVTIGSEALNDKAVLTLMTPTGNQGFNFLLVENKGKNKLRTRRKFKATEI